MIPGVVAGDRPPGPRDIRWSRTAFLAAGLVPTFWLLRRMPIGFFYMFGFWTAVGSAVLLVFVFVYKWREPSLARTIPFLAAGIPVGLVLLAMIGPSRADARGEAMPLSDVQIRALAIVIQAVLAIRVARRTRQSGQRVLELMAVYLAALATMTIRLTAARHVSAWWFVPVIAVLAVRMATLPEASAARFRADPGGRRLVRTSCAFVAIVGALALQAQIVDRPAGVLALIVAFAGGLTILVARRSPTPLAGGGAVTVAVALFAPVLFVVVLLMPSLAGARYLLDIGFDHEPDGLAVEGSRPVPGGYQRWYGTTLDEAAALAAVTEAFRVPPVSARPDADGHGITALLFGYRIESRYNAVPQLCGAAPGCMVITVRRSTQ